jgi:hypothetical protein
MNQVAAGPPGRRPPIDPEKAMLLLKVFQGAQAAVAGRLAAPVPYREAADAWPVAEERVADAVVRRLAERFAPQEGAAAPARRVTLAVRRVEEEHALYGRGHAAHEVRLV